MSRPLNAAKRSKPAAPQISHETIEALIARAAVNPGWSPGTWALRLEQLADACAARHAEEADRLRRWAARVRSMIPGPQSIPECVKRAMMR